MKLCQQCGKPINERTDRNVRFCSRACFGKSRRKSPSYRVCPQCNRQFVVPPKNPNTKYCSTNCRDAAWTTLLNLSCDHCGKPIQVRPQYAAKLKHHFCSRQCCAAWRHLNDPRGGKHPRYSRVTVYCTMCGKKFTRAQHETKGKRHFCGRQCCTLWQSSSGHFSGKNNGNWKGGYKPYYGPNWAQQRRNARHRDRYSCQRCTATESELGRQLDVHHIRAFREFGIEQYREANKLRNLICYCASCHQIIEGEQSQAERAAASAPRPTPRSQRTRATGRSRQGAPPTEETPIRTRSAM